MLGNTYILYLTTREAQVIFGLNQIRKNMPLASSDLWCIPNVYRTLQRVSFILTSCHPNWKGLAKSFQYHCSGAHTCRPWAESFFPMLYEFVLGIFKCLWSSGCWPGLLHFWTFETWLDAWLQNYWTHPSKWGSLKGTSVAWVKRSKAFWANHWQILLLSFLFFLWLTMLPWAGHVVALFLPVFTCGRR